MPAFRSLIVAAVSTEVQASDEKASLADQLAGCRALCETRGWPIVGEIQIPGHSRNYNWLHEIVRDCPEYGEMIDLVEGEQVDLIVCRDYDRLWRTDALRAQVMAICREHRVQVFSLNQPVEPVAPDLMDVNDSARLSEVLFGYISEQENRTRVRRVQAGKRRRIERGLDLCGPHVPYGYRRGTNGILDIAPDTVAWVRWIFQRRADDRWGYDHIAKELTLRGVPTPQSSSAGIWSSTGIRSILDNPIYIGHVRWGQFYNENGLHPRIIEDALWERVQQVKDLHAIYIKRGNARRGYALTGLLRCGYCGRAMAYVPTGRGSLGIRCSRYLSSHGTDCQSNWMRVEPLESLVLRTVKAAIRNPEAFLAARRDERATKDIQHQLQTIEATIEDQRARWQRWNAAFESGAISLAEMAEHRQRIHAAIDQLTADRERLQGASRAEEGVVVALASLQEIADELDRLDDADLNRVYLSLIASIEIKQHEPPHIRWL
jgi:site-specific DNA recombinase